MWYIQASAWEKIPLFSKFCSHQTASSGFAACLWHLLRAKVVLHFSEDTQKHHWSCCFKWYIWAPHFHFSMRALQFTVIQGKSDIKEVAGFITASGRFRMLVWFSSGKTGALFSASSSCQRSFYCPCHEEYTQVAQNLTNLLLVDRALKTFVSSAFKCCKLIG